MGSVKKFLHKSTLPDRETHHSRLFIDLAENIHIHHREYRTVFSLDEYFEYADIVTSSTVDVRNFLAQNSDYKEQAYPTTILIAGGKERQLKFLEHSTKANKSAYFDDVFAIELQDEYVTDEIHIHYRDFRIGLDRTRFRLMAEGFKTALIELDEFENNNSYERKSHPDRLISDFNNNDLKLKGQIMGAVPISLSDIKSYWHNKIEDWVPNKQSIELLIESLNNNVTLCPIVVSTESDGSHLIIDGHHRYYAHQELRLAVIDCIVLNEPFSKTEKLRKAEVLLKEFDQESGYKYNMSNYYKSYISHSLNRYYSDVFRHKVKKHSLTKKAVIKILSIVGLKEFVFKYVYEPHNNHNNHKKNK